MEEKFLKLMAQLALIAIVIWIIAAAFGRRDDAKVYTAPSSRSRWRQREKGDMWQRGCVAASYAQGTFQPGFQMSPLR